MPSFICSHDQLQIHDRYDMRPVTIAKDFTNETYSSDVTIRFMSNGLSGNFKLEYFPGTFTR